MFGTDEFDRKCLKLFQEIFEWLGEKEHSRKRMRSYCRVLATTLDAAKHDLALCLRQEEIERDRQVHNKKEEIKKLTKDLAKLKGEAIENE